MCCKDLGLMMWAEGSEEALSSLALLSSFLLGPSQLCFSALAQDGSQWPQQSAGWCMLGPGSLASAPVYLVSSEPSRDARCMLPSASWSSGALECFHWPCLSSSRILPGLLPLSQLCRATCWCAGALPGVLSRSSNREVNPKTCASAFPILALNFLSWNCHPRLRSDKQGMLSPRPKRPFPASPLNPSPAQLRGFPHLRAHR